MNNKAAFLFDPKSDSAMLGGGNWQMPLSNAQDDRYWRVARSASVDPADTRIEVDMGGIVSLMGFALLVQNATTGIRVRVSSQASGAFDEDLISTGWMEAGQRIPYGTLPFGAPYWWNGLEPWPDRDKSPVLSAAFEERIAARYWLIEFDDHENPDGYLDVGRVFLAGGLSPSFNYSYDGNGLGIRDNSITAKTLSGSRRIWRRPNPREFQCQFQYLPEDEMYRDVYGFLSHVGFDREVFLIPDPSETEHAQARRFFATISQMDRISQSAPGRASTGFALQEII